MIARSLIQFRGSFGKVRLLVDKSTQQKLAAKVIDKKPGHAMYMEQLQREVRVMKMMDHPNVVKLVEVFETPSKIYLVMELYVYQLFCA